MAQRLKTDWILFFTVLAMVLSGVLVVYSASAIMAQMGPNHSPWYFVKRQAVWAVLALCIMCKTSLSIARKRGVLATRSLLRSKRPVSLSLIHI